VAKGHLRPNQAEPADMVDRRAVAAPPRIFLLTGRFQQSMCNGTLYLRERSDSRRNMSSEQCRLAGASWILARRLFWCWP
jgi:hypothetical protein